MSKQINFFTISEDLAHRYNWKNTDLFYLTPNFVLPIEAIYKNNSQLNGESHYSYFRQSL